MSEFFRAMPAHKLWSMAILFVTPVLLLVSFRFGLTIEKTRPWGWRLGVISLGLWIVLMATDDPRVDFVTAFMLSFFTTIEWVAWFERRRAVKRNAA